MGEAPSFSSGELQGKLSSGILVNSNNQTAVDINNKTYVIDANDTESSRNIRVFNKSTHEWVNPILLGVKPKLSEKLSALSIDEDRILIVNGNSTSNDCCWFLEVNTPFVKDQKLRLETEVVAWSKGVIGETEKPIVISGPSGVGKGTLISKLMQEFQSMFGFSVSHTTRAQRNNEQNGVHYHFTERNVMEKDIENGKFLEFASVHGNLYGTSVEAVDAVSDQGKRCILDIDVQGARSVRSSSLEAVFIFVRPPSFEELEKRLRARGTETEEQIQKRLRNAKAELEQGSTPGLFDHVLVNDDLDECYENLKDLLNLNKDVKTIAKSVHVPLEHAVSKVDQKIFIHFNDVAKEKTASDMFYFDLSSIKGGAPGRTRGLYIFYTAKSSEDVSNN